MTKPLIGISIGDINGIGPEILIRTLHDNRILEHCTPIIFANTKILNFYKKSLPDLNIQFNAVKDFTKLNPKLVNVYTCWEDDVDVQPGVENADGGKYAIRSLQVATQCLKDKQINALVTMPISKNNTQLPDFKHLGHTPFLKEKFAAKDVLMFMVAENLRVALLTEHVAVADISKHITKDNIKSKLAMLSNSLIKDFGIVKPKIAVLGLNPHAGDGGQIGKEERDIIKPTLDELNGKGMYLFGPYAADGFFARNQQQNFDAVLAMYHDQGLIPFKTFDNLRGVNFTAGLPVVRTSPDHGTGFDIAGKNIADTGSFTEALFTCIDILNYRENHTFFTANPLKRGIGLSLLKKKNSKEDVVE
jgi:4-hydroxythreonine-4-phosphate dehydrogenase